jgi:hypothetical protein
MRFFETIILTLALMACTTTSTRSAADVKPQSVPAGARVLVLSPDVELSMLLATGLQEPKAEWTRQGRENMAAEIDRVLTTRGHKTTSLDVTTAMDGRIGQVLRLHEAVAQSILSFHYGQMRLPTKGKDLDWTLGEGAKELGAKYEADYALFTYARGAYASGGRIALGVVAAVAGAGIVPMGQQQVFALIVDLRTGQVVWSNIATAGPQADMREAEGAQTLIQSILEKAPL